MSSVPGWGRSPGGGHSNPLQYSCLENPHGQRSLAGDCPWGSQRVGHDWATERACSLAPAPGTQVSLSSSSCRHYYNYASSSVVPLGVVEWGTREQPRPGTAVLLLSPGGVWSGSTVWGGAALGIHLSKAIFGQAASLVGAIAWLPPRSSHQPPLRATLSGKGVSPQGHGSLLPTPWPHRTGGSLARSLAKAGGLWALTQQVGSEMSPSKSCRWEFVRGSPGTAPNRTGYQMYIVLPWEPHLAWI